MSKVTIVVPKEYTNDLLDVILKSKMLHLIKIESNLLNEIHELNLKKEELQYLNTLYQDLDRFFQSYNKPIDFTQNNGNQIQYQEAKQFLIQLQEQQAKWKQEIALVEQNENIILQYESLIDNFQQLIPELSEGSDLNVRGILISNPTYDIQIMLELALKKQTQGNYHLITHQISPKLTIGSITYPRIYDLEMKEILEKLSITDVILPKELPGKTIGEKIRNFESQRKVNESKRNQIFLDLDQLHQNYLLLSNHKKFIYESYYKSEGLKFLKTSELFVFLEAFVTRKNLEELKKILGTHLKCSFSINVEQPKANAPIKISNRRGIREFEIFTGMVQPIAYNTIDPTLFMAIVFPLFYGFIIGDIGYGIIIALIGFILYKKFYDSKGDMKSISNLGWVFFVSGLSSIFFGLLFGEFFGNLGQEIGLEPLLYHRSENILELLIISIVIGVIHVMIGFTLGTINARKIGDNHKFVTNIGYLLTNLGFITIALSIILYLEPMFQTLALFMVGIGILLLVRFEGIVAVIELISCIGNMLSYARLMALGIASVILADIANDFYFIIGGGILGILLVVIMHTLNIVIAMFSPLIHSMRLHLVEFFSKFVFDGTEQFSPFGES